MDERAQYKKYIVIGSSVLLCISENDPKEKWFQGTVKGILDNREYAENGIKIEDMNSIVGYTKKILDRDLTQFDVEKIIEKTEIAPLNQMAIEFKSTFQFDIVNNTKEEKLKYECAKEIAAFMNTSGGYLLIGVEDDGNVIGLEHDYSCLNIRQGQSPSDKFKQEISDYLCSILKIEPRLINDIIMFKFDNDKEICIILVEKQDKPVFIDTEIQLWDAWGSRWKNTSTKMQAYLKKDVNTKVRYGDIRERFETW